MEKENPAMARGASENSDQAALLISSDNTASGRPAQRQRLPNKRRSLVFNFQHGGSLYHCTASRFEDGRLGEIFLSCSKAGSGLQQHADTAAILCSLLLQNGVAADVIAKAVAGSPVAVAIGLATAP